MKKIYTLLLFILGAGYSMNAQDVRYVDEIFTDVESMTDITYGANVTIITVADTSIMAPSIDTLMLDVHTPAGDTETSRPLVVLFHTGNFLPQLVNGQINGDKQDPYVVHLAQKLVRRGYVVACPNYRLGWNPIAIEQDERTETLINAAYRGVQDAKTVARFFRRSIEEQNNPFGIDGDKFVAWGVGTGAYISLAATSLDDFEDTLLPKFIKEDENGNPVPMVDTLLVGDPDGLTTGVINIPNHPGFNGDYQLCTNMGGALGDVSWLDESDPPIISFHVPSDPFAPYTTGVLKVPTTGDLVVEVSGSYDAQATAHDLGLNDVFVNGVFDDEVTSAANSRNDGLEGLMPMPRPLWPNPTDPMEFVPLEAGPWEFWDATFWGTEPWGQLGLNGPGGPCEGAPIELCNWHLISLRSNPDMSFDKADSYQDSIVQYYAPRACLALDLAECAALYSSVGDEFIANEISISPNPVKDQFIINADELTIESITIHDITGKTLEVRKNVGSSIAKFDRQDWGSGFYLARVQINDRFVTKKFILE